MVDELRAWPGRASSAQARRIFGSGKQSCHLTTDGPLSELHDFAWRIGMPPSWFQDHRIAPHYDLTPKRRERALKAGAVFVPLREQLRKGRATQESPT